MTYEDDAGFSRAEFEAIESELLLNLIAIVKIQQLNIALLWKAIGIENEPVQAVATIRESTDRLAECIENVYGLVNSRRSPAPMN